MITFDPPKHTDYRGLLMRLLTPKRLQENEAFMGRLADQRIDGFIAKGKSTLVAPVRPALLHACHRRPPRCPEETTPRPRQLRGCGHAGRDGEGRSAKSSVVPRGLLHPVHRGPPAGTADDVMTKMALGTFSDGSIPELIETVRVAAFLFAGGQGTVARFLGNSLMVLAENAELQRLLRDDRDRIPNFVEEMLRLNSPVKVNLRMARKDDDDRRGRDPRGQHRRVAPARPRIGTLSGSDAPRSSTRTGATRASTSRSAAGSTRVRVRHLCVRTRESRSSTCSTASPTFGSQMPNTDLQGSGGISTPTPGSCTAWIRSTWSSGLWREPGVNRSFADGPRPVFDRSV